MISLKKLFLLCSGISFMFLTTACLTPELWNPPTYQETFDQIYIAKGGNTLAVLGKKYHYIFLTPDKLKQFLAWKNNNKARINLNYFKVNNANAISGSYSLYIEEGTLPDTDKTWLADHGLCTPSACNFTENLQGTRYLAENFPTNLSATKLAQSYTVRIEEPMSASGKVARAAVTPVTVLADGTLALAVGVVIIPILAVSTLSGN
jgi:hypothetical protein